MPGITGRSPRINRKENMIYKDWVIPKGVSIHPFLSRKIFSDIWLKTVIGMTTRQMHWDERIFPDPQKFQPERWLGDEKKRSLKYFAPFGKGSRNCLGLNLAWAELYVTIGNLFRRFEFELYDTKQEDISVQRDHFSPVPHPGSHGVWVKVKAEVECWSSGYRLKALRFMCERSRNL